MKLRNFVVRLSENGYQLCHRYWPEEGSEQYHIFEVILWHDDDNDNDCDEDDDNDNDNDANDDVSGTPGVGACLVWWVPGEISLSQEQPDWGDQDCHPVPLPLLAWWQHSNIYQGDPGVQKVGIMMTFVRTCCNIIVVDVVVMSNSELSFHFRALKKPDMLQQTKRIKIVSCKM